MKLSKDVLTPFLALCLVFNCCISFKVRPLALPENLEAQITLCRKIDESGELLRPLEITSEFSAEIDYIFCFLELMNVQGEIRLKWKWFSPDNMLFRESKEAVVNKAGNLLESVTAYDKISVNFEDEVFGEWIVIVLLNDSLIARKSFIINK
jgi:hypothetical protein